MNVPAEKTLGAFEFLFGSQNALLAIIIAAVGALIAFFSYRHNKRSVSAMRRLEDVISPLFELIEPSMMRDAPPPDPQTVQSVLALLRSQLMLAGGSLRPYALLSPKELSSPPVWNQLCKDTSRQYDRLCSWCSIPKRSIQYRTRYKTRFSILPIVLLVVRAMASFGLFIIAVLIALALLRYVLLAQYEYVLPTVASLFVSILLYLVTAP